MTEGGRVRSGAAAPVKATGVESAEGRTAFRRLAASSTCSISWMATESTVLNAYWL
jgi:hypothetical protein